MEIQSADAWITIYKEGSILESGYSDSNGQIRLIIPTIEEGEVLVTVTKKITIPIRVLSKSTILALALMSFPKKYLSLKMAQVPQRVMEMAKLILVRLLISLYQYLIMEMQTQLKLQAH